MEFIIIEKWLWYKNQAIAGFKKGYDHTKSIEMYLKLCKEKYKQTSNEDILTEMVEKKVPKPDSFPQFSNENPFKLKWDDGYIVNPKILKIKWDNGWQYELENIGHKYSFQDENQLSIIF